MKRMQAKRRKSYVGLLGKSCLAGFAMYLVFSFAFTQLEILTKRQELLAIETQIEQQQEDNMEIERLIFSGSEIDYIERVARDRYNYATPNERVFIDITGQ